MQEWLRCHELFYLEDEDIQVRLGKKDRPVDVTAYSSAANGFEDKQDGQGGSRHRSSGLKGSDLT